MRKTLLLLTASVVLGEGALLAGHLRAGDVWSAHLAAIRTTAELVTPALKTAQSPLGIALLLRNQIHRAGLLPDEGVPGLDSEELADWSHAYDVSILERERGNRCNGKALLYMAALQAYGIDSRMVALYAGKFIDQTVYSHAAVDVRIDGRWVALDPTYDLSYKNEQGQFMSWEEVVMALRAGKNVVADHDGMVTLTTPKPIDLAQRVKYVVFSPWSGGPALSLNPEWDGKITYPDGKVFDAWNNINNSLYQQFALPLR